MWADICLVIIMIIIAFGSNTIIAHGINKHHCPDPGVPKSADRLNGV